MATRKVPKRVNHLISIKAFTRQSFPMPLPTGTSLESAVEDLLEKWESERAGRLSIPSSITFATLLSRSRQTNRVLPRITEEPAAIHSFAYYPSLLGALQIRDDKGVILGYRFKIPPHLLTTLNDASKVLDSYSPGLYAKRRYAVWADDKKYVESRELSRDGERGREWLRGNQELFDYCSNQLRFLCPEQYVRMTGSVVKDIAKAVSADGRNLRPLGGAWHGVCLNQGIDSGESRPDQNWMDDKQLLNCVVPFGGSGELVLWQMKTRIGLEVGDGFFFYGSLVAHEMKEMTTGFSNWIDLFTRASNYELLAEHRKAAGKHHPKKVRAKGGKGENRKGKKQKQRAAGVKRKKSEGCVG